MEFWRLGEPDDHDDLPFVAADNLVSTQTSGLARIHSIFF
jgi:hypothetical protein